LSIYHLTLEPNTAFARQPPALPDDDLASDMLDLIVQQASASGLQRYEVSAFAKPGHRCAHNLNYWGFGDYLGIGAGAHGKLSFAHRVVRQQRWRDPATYMAQALAGHALSNQQELKRKDLVFEYMLGALRLREGFLLSQFNERTGLPLSSLQDVLHKAQARGLLDWDQASDRVQATVKGFDFLSDLQAMFLPTDAPTPSGAQLAAVGGSGSQLTATDRLDP
jgi:oxygen-independent coproporphyrinogen-3 oxidase